MPKWCKMIVGILLLPVCFGALNALWKVMTYSRSATEVWVAIGGGAACWAVVFLMLPKPMWIYVVGHEFTHVLWSWLFGGSVKAFKARSTGGHVVVTKSNFLVALAPYFFPVYAGIVVTVFIIGHLIWNWAAYVVWFHLLLGAAYAFHVTLTWHILQTKQTDITEQGYLFSAVIIFLGNVGVLILGVPMLASRVGVLTALKWWMVGTGQVVERLGRLF